MVVYRTLIFYILVFAPFVLYGQLPPQQDSKTTDINKIEKLIIHYRYDQPDSATYYADWGMKVAKRTNDDEGVARMLNQMGMIDDNLGKAESSRQKYLESLEIYKRLHNNKGIIKENVRLGVVENRKGNYDQASKYFLTALKTSESIKDKAGIMESYITLGEVYASQKLYTRAISYYLRAEQLEPSLPFSSLKLNLYSDFGAAYRELRNFKKAIAYYNKGIAQSNYSEMMGLNISMTNGLAQVYAKAGEIDKAISLQKGALLKSRKISNFIREFLSLTALAESYNKIDPSVSSRYLQEALALARSRHANKQMVEVLAKIADLENSKNNFKAAYMAKSQQYSIADSFYFKDISARIANLQAEYELNKSQVKVQELKFINSKQVFEQRIMAWIIAASAVVLLVMGFYYFKIRKLNRLLNKSNTALINSNNVKDKLFSVLAHDLRGPLASVINLLGMIDRGWLSEKEKELMIAKLAVQCSASMETLNLLLKWGQMQLKGVFLNQSTIYPSKIIDRNILLLKESAEQKSIKIGKDVPAEIYVYADPDHLDFVIRNLLSNAIKFTPVGGQIHVTVREQSENRIRFMIKDNGIGIDKDRIEAIFNINNVSTNGTNNEKGTSLGLVICKEFIVANNGVIGVESVLAEGSEFYFMLNKT